MPIWKPRAETRIALTVFALSSFVATAPAQAQIDVALIASTEGAGLEVAATMNPLWRVRFGATGWSADEDLTAGQVPYEATADLKWGSAIVDWSLAGGAFHLSAGVVLNDHSIEGTADVLDVAINEFGQAQVDAILALLPAGVDPGILRAEVSFDSVSPYVGFGWRTTKPGGLGLAFDLGAILLGDATATVTYETGLPIDLVPGGQEQLDAFLIEQQMEIEREAEDYEIYPVARFGIFYRF